MDRSTRNNRPSNDGPSPLVNCVTEIALGIIVLFSAVSFLMDSGSVTEQPANPRIVLSLAHQSR